MKMHNLNNSINPVNAALNNSGFKADYPCSEINKNNFNKSNPKIMFYSTNKKSGLFSIKEAMLMGLAPDKGLFMPNHIPQIPFSEIVSFKKKDYASIASRVARDFFSGYISKEELIRIASGFYYYDVPLEHVAGNIYILRLDCGPTASFKDFGAGMMAGIMQKFLKEDNKKAVILAATSGDTGSAVANAYYGYENVDVVILFPKNEVSETQRKQMTTLGGNVKAIALNGKFDDCQSLVKKAFSDPDLNSLNLTSANSINIGRLIPQIAYYFYAFSRIGLSKAVFSVPSGNFGNLMAGMLAKKMGLPIKKMIAGVNENNEFPVFLETGVYKPVIPSKKCISNAMNIGHPSNLARLFELYDGWIDEKGFIFKMPDLEKMRQDIFSVSVSDDATINAVRSFYRKYGSIIEPHGAVAWSAIKEYLKKHPFEDAPIICLETAHPAKFQESLNSIGIYPEAPESIKALKNKKELIYAEIGPDYGEFKNILKTKMQKVRKNG